MDRLPAPRHPAAGLGRRRRPGIAFAQAFGRWGNWFNQELYGRETHVPWALHITSSTDGRVPGYYHPTFLYESLWCVGVGFLVIWADRRFKLGHGRAFALYVAAYCVGRAWIEYMRVDDAHHILGVRLNDWTAIAVFLLAVLYIVLSSRWRPGREEIVEPGASDTGTGADDPVDLGKDEDKATTDKATATDTSTTTDKSTDRGKNEDENEGEDAEPSEKTESAAESAKKV